MGNDGGSIPKRRELVKEAARAQTTTEMKETLQEQQEYCWTTCPLSQGPLKEPVVSDWGGNLYNKDAVIEFLLPSEDPSEEASKTEKAKILEGRIKSLKDVVEVKFHVDETLENGRTAAHFEKRWSCPVTSKTLGAGVKAVYLVPCGHAFEEAAIKNASEGICLQCEEPFEFSNVIPILPLAEKGRDRLVARAQTLKEKGLAHSLKKLSSKKRKKGAVETFNAEPGQVETAKDKAKAANKQSAAPNGIKNASTASLNAKVQAELEEKAKRRKLDTSENLKGLFSTNQKKPLQDSDFMTRGYSLPKQGR